MSEPFQLLQLFVSRAHNYFGHHGRPAGRNPVHAVHEASCVAGRGIQGDRFFDHEADHKGQITFFASEAYQSLCEQFGIRDKSASVFRRNVLVRGLDLSTLIGQEFEVQGVRFQGVEECRPCHWMDLAFCPGAEAALRGRGGLRARILTSGTLRIADPTVGFSRERARTGHRPLSLNRQEFRPA